MDQRMDQRIGTGLEKLGEGIGVGLMFVAAAIAFSSLVSCEQAKQVAKIEAGITTE